VCSHETKEGEDVLEVSFYAGPAGGNILLDANNQPRLLGLVSRLHGMWSVSAEMVLVGFIQCQGRQRHAGQDASLFVLLACGRSPCRMLITCAFSTFCSRAFRNSKVHLPLKSLIVFIAVFFSGEYCN
jgi:hypothetical protein